MTFQTVFDYAESISVERKQVVASTTSRSGIVRAVSRGASTWQFAVKLPDGPRWTDWRGIISKLEYLDRVSAANVQLNTTGQEWFSQYQGNSINSTGFAATWVQGNNTITLTTSPTTSSGFKFKAGDLIQLGSTGKVYTVAADVAFNSNSVTLHRPIIDASLSAQAIRVGPNCVFNLRCVSFPTWTIFARDQVSWSGPFVFTEVL